MQGSARVLVGIVEALSGPPRPVLHPSSRYATWLANRPLLAHAIDELAQAGVDHVAIAAWSGHSGPEQDRLPRIEAPTGPVSTIEIPTGADPAQVIARLRAAVEAGPALIRPGDCLFPGQLRRLRDHFDQPGVDMSVMAPSSSHAPAIRPARPGQAQLSRARDAIPALAGNAAILAGPAWPALEHAAGATTTDELLESVRSEGLNVARCQPSQQWRYSDATDELLSANRMLLDRLPAAEPAAAADSDVEGRVRISPTARVVRSRLRGPVVVGDGAVLEDAFVGPYTAVGPDAVVLGAEIDYTMVLPGAEIRYPGRRMQGCLIGEGAIVRQTFSMPAGMRLRIGAGAEVMLD